MTDEKDVQSEMENLEEYENQAQQLIAKIQAMGATLKTDGKVIQWGSKVGVMDENILQQLKNIKPEIIYELQSQKRQSKKQDLVIVRDGQVIADSMVVADVFGRRHVDVVATIEKMKCSAEFSKRNFSRSEYTTERGKSYPKYDLTRDGCALLVMGFTGEGAIKWKEKYIEAFNKMEEQLRGAVQIPQTYSEALRLAADEADRANKAEEALALTAPKIERLDRIEATVGCVTVTEAAKMLGIGPKALFRRLNAEKWIYKNAGARNWLGYQKKINQGLVEHKDSIYKNSDGEEMISTYAKITGKGLSKLAGILNKQLHLIGVDD